MNTEFETIDSGAMEVLAEFPCAIHKETDAFRLGIVGEFFVISSRSKRIKIKDAEQMTERERLVDDYNRQRDYWSGLMFFEVKNFNAVLQRLQEVYGEIESLLKSDNAFDIRGGKDLIAIEKNVVVPHNAGKPIVTLMISNQRPAEIDLLRLGGFTLYLEPADGLKLMDEMKLIQPIVELKIQRRAN